MKERMMFKIGEFARVGQVSIATLRHYDQYGLLKPSALDPDSGYRYYLLDQLPRLNRIVALKDLGFPLEQIAQLLEENLSLEYLQGMFRLKQAQIQQIVDTEQARLMRIAARLRQIEQEGNMPTYEVRLKQVEPLLVASLREIVSIEDGPGWLQRRISAHLEQQGVQRSQPDVLLFHSRYELHDDGLYADMEIASPLPSTLAGNEQVRVRTLPGGLMASTIHTGYALSVGQAHAALHSWMANNGYRLIGPVRLIHLQRAEHMGSGQCVTEVQFQIEKQEA